MKKLFLLAISTLLVLNLSANELAWVDEQVEAIKPARVGVSSYEISQIKDPFIFLDKNGKYKEKKYRTKITTRAQNKNFKSSSDKKNLKLYRGSLILEGIINNSALISGKWYKLNERIKSYKLTKVNNSSVVLSLNGKNLVLSTNTKNKTLKFNNN